MSKQLLINDRPADNGGYSGGGDFGGAGGDWPKASIGNYKGVMLCNRPNEMGGQRATDSSGNQPFNSRVMHEEPLGWNPVKKLFPKINKRRIDPNNALTKHRRFLRALVENKIKEKEDRERDYRDKEERKKKFLENASQQRKKIKDLKRDDVLLANELQEQGPTDELPQARLTEENLKKNDELSQQEAKKKKSQGTKRPK